MLAGQPQRVTHTGAGAAATADTKYLHRDHLGSVEVISDVSGMIVERLSFDSWGRRRQGDWQPMTDAAIYSFDTALTTNRGYTGHEQLDSVGLVHMNGRVYDPTLGRFLSADPHVQAPGNLQNWNRYSYVLNNPLSYTDPTGFFFNKLFKALGSAFGKLFSAIGSAFKKLLNSGILRSVIQVVGCLALPVVGCAALTAAITLAAGGSIQDALMAAAFAFAQINIYEHIVGPMLKGAHFLMQSAVHGAVGGAMAVVRGGNFLVGFAAGALGKIGSVVTRGIDNFALRLGVSAAFGCAGSMIGGGKCANGAVTAAFAHIYNEMGGVSGRFAVDRDEARAERHFRMIGREVSGAVVSTVLEFTPQGKLAVGTVVVGGVIFKTGTTILSGQVHHAISRKIFTALQNHPLLRGVYSARDNRFVLQASSKQDHIGYQGWHRAVDKKMIEHLARNPQWTPQRFETYLRRFYTSPAMRSKFPNGFQ